MFLAATDFTQQLMPPNSTLGSTLVALLPLALLLVLLAVMRVTAWLAVIIGAVVTIIMAITIWGFPAGPTLQAWGVGAGTAIWSIDWIVVDPHLPGHRPTGPAGHLAAARRGLAVLCARPVPHVPISRALSA